MADGHSSIKFEHASVAQTISSFRGLQGDMEKERTMLFDELEILHTSLVGSAGNAAAVFRTETDRVFGNLNKLSTDIVDALQGATDSSSAGDEQHGQQLQTAINGVSEGSDLLSHGQ
ncbi:MAG TPA: hypothetical protein VE172_04565 [Stackebrandtia sp.]|jgi:hypothetical protein|uniref:hypothetical protein n=1 Tax=Stackebrandtia sp. TaxID=2023065 RepID=UPI002D344D10|nr:hypothetical protein [Stackebrandtia sp.]HZE38066.1 hypothetical protein [Stackebrandtia sp.]